MWRRGGDSNPRHRFCQCNCLAGSPVRPLQHLSAAVSVLIRHSLCGEPACHSNEFENQNPPATSTRSTRGCFVLLVYHRCSREFVHFVPRGLRFINSVARAIRPARRILFCQRFLAVDGRKDAGDTEVSLRGCLLQKRSCEPVCRAGPMARTTRNTLCPSAFYAATLPHVIRGKVFGACLASRW